MLARFKCNSMGLSIMVSPSKTFSGITNYSSSHNKPLFPRPNNHDPTFSSSELNILRNLYDLCPTYFNFLKAHHMLVIVTIMLLFKAH